MINGNDRLDRIERILEEVAKKQDQAADGLKQTADGLKQTADALKRTADSLTQVDKTLQDMAARQQYHDEAFERHDSEMKVIREAIAMDAENIRALARIADAHNRRLEDLEGGPAN
jgi:methyl-accepting chemotaxis protein